jgi:ribosome-associated heat shock protein Hsp15
MGKMIPFLSRIDVVIAPSTKGLKGPVAGYFHSNVHITTDGMFTGPPLSCAAHSRISCCCRLPISKALTAGAGPRSLAREWNKSGVRIDKWLWAARFFKTRSLAARACELGRIETNGQKSKASREVRVRDMLQVRTEGGDFQVEVLTLSEIRGPAAMAQTLYRETETSREERLKLAEERKAMPRFAASREGRPAKRDRRAIDRLRGKV